jgi:transposase-like protein
VGVALKVVSMQELKLAVLLEPERTGVSVAEVCRRHGISRASYYRYRRRYLDEGVAGLEARSRRPRSSPGQIDAELEVEIVTMRKRHPRWGARRIHAELARAGREPPGATVRILEVGELVHIYLGDQLIRALAPDRSKRYQKLGNRGRRRS